MKTTYLLILTVLLTASGTLMAQPTLDWEVKHERLSGRAFSYSETAVDSAGNVYLTGYAFGSGSAEDYTTVKYDRNGKRLWVATYNGPGNGIDRAYTLVIDSSGNVYVTGHSAGAVSGADYATVKYDSNGNQLWVARYNGPGNGYDRGGGLVVDAAGNVHVSGRSLGSGTSDDYATVKYDSNGNQLWVARYNGPANSTDYGGAIAVDTSGNVYVGGRSIGIGSAEDYATVKYDSSGTELWVARYNGSANGSDEGYALAIDGTGNTYVTGQSHNGTDYDYATVKYNSSGVEQWVSRYDGPGSGWDVPYALVVDGSGDIYVAGESYSGSNIDCATVKYNSGGTIQWVARYNGTANGWDTAFGLVVDVSGNVYITGYSENLAISNRDFVTVKYDSSGTELWASLYNGPANTDDYAYGLFVDGAGNVYVTGTSDDIVPDKHYAVLKYDSSGTQQWVSRFVGIQSRTQLGSGDSLRGKNCVATDAAGNTYVTGSSENSNGDNDYETVKYNSIGVQQWVARYNGTGNSDDYSYALAIDNTGNVYVTGGSIGGGADYDYATVKYNSSGAVQWVARYNGTGNNHDQAYAIAIDGSGNVYVTGQSVGSGGTFYDYATVRYNSSGIQQWVARYNGPAGSVQDYAYAIAVDAAGNVYVTGESADTGTSEDYATLMYNSAGTQQWVARYNGPASGRDQAYALAIDGTGNVYVTGQSAGSGTSNDYATVKYNSIGVEQWVARYDGPANDSDLAYALTVDVSGNVYVTGQSTNGSNWDYATVKYNGSGTQVWAARYNGPANGDDQARALAVDGSGNVFVTGQSFNGSNYDYATVRYNSSGTEQWSRLDDSGGDDFGRAIALAPGSMIVVAGDGRGPVSGDTAFWTLQLYDNPAPVVGISTTPVAYLEGDPATQLDAAATVTDPDSADFDGGFLSVAYTAGGPSTTNDQLGLASTTVRDNSGTVEYDASGSFSGSQVAVGGVNATDNGVNGADLVVNFIASCTPAIAQEILRAVTYSNGSQDPSAMTRTVRITVDDGDGSVSNQPTLDINVTPVNDAPTLGTVNTLTGASKDTQFVILFSTLAAAADEADVDSTALSFRIEAISTGTVTINSGGVTPGTTLFATGDQIEWTPDLNATGTQAAFTIVAWDGALASSIAVQVSVSVAAGSGGSGSGSDGGGCAVNSSDSSIFLVLLLTAIALSTRRRRNGSRPVDRAALPACD